MTGVVVGILESSRPKKTHNQRPIIIIILGFLWYSERASLSFPLPVIRASRKKSFSLILCGRWGQTGRKKCRIISSFACRRQKQTIITKCHYDWIAVLFVVAAQANEWVIAFGIKTRPTEWWSKTTEEARHHITSGQGALRYLWTNSSARRETMDLGDLYCHQSRLIMFRVIVFIR